MYIVATLGSTNKIVAILMLLVEQMVAALICWGGGNQETQSLVG